MTRSAVRMVRRAAQAFIADPIETLVLARETLAELNEQSGPPPYEFMPWPPCPYEVDESWEKRLHELVGAPWPCTARDEFWPLWHDVMNSLGAKGLNIGRAAFDGWGDGEPGFARAVWCLTHHLKPRKIVETGVARGVTSRFILEALAR